MSDELAVFSALKHPLKIGTKLDINKNMQQTIEIVDCKWNEQENMYVYTKFVFQEKSAEGYVGFTPAVEGIDVADFLGITKYEPIIPAK